MINTRLSGNSRSVLIIIPVLLLLALPFAIQAGFSKLIFSLFFIPLAFFSSWVITRALTVLQFHANGIDYLKLKFRVFVMHIVAWGFFMFLGFMASAILSATPGFSWLIHLGAFMTIVIIPFVAHETLHSLDGSAKSPTFVKKENSLAVIYAKKRFLGSLGIAVFSFMALVVYSSYSNLSILPLLMLIVLVALINASNMVNVVFPVIRATIAFNECEVDPELKDLFAEITFFSRDQQDSIIFNKGFYTAKISQTIAEVGLISEQINPVSEQIKLDVERLKEGSAIQISALGELSGMIENMHHNLVQNYRSARFAKKISEKAVESVNKMSVASTESLVAIERIVEKVKVINDIAHQTNIISLNAAMEAARVGDEGRGFAVVAGQVRQLAELSKTASEEIIKLSRETIESTEKTQALAKTLAPEVQNTANLLRDVTLSSEEHAGKDKNLNIKEVLDRLNAVIDNCTQSYATLKLCSNHVEDQASLLNKVVENLSAKNDPSVYKSGKPKVFRNLLPVEPQDKIAGAPIIDDRDFADNNFETF